MRIISGSRRGHKLVGFDGDSIRPTTDRVKESMFNLIAGYVSGAFVLDLFCGSGALSMETLSRGASLAVCVDSDRRSLEIAAKNAENLRFSDIAVMVNKTALEYIGCADIQFDIIFMDPPYNRGFIEPVISKIVERDILSDDGIIVLESDSTDVHDDISGVHIEKKRKYGRTYITIYGKGENICE